MGFRVVVTIALLMAPALAQAQMHIDVQNDRVSFGGGEFVPRFARHLTQSLIVSRGETVTLPADSTWNAIEVEGTLRVATDRDTTVRFSHLMVLPGGRLEVQAPCGQTVTFIIRDTPIDTALDPFQWGNGILIFGAADMRGCAMSAAWVPLREGVPAGATSLPLDVPDGWHVGDSLLIPDSRQQSRPPEGFNGRNPPRRESPVRIAGIAGDRRSLTLTKPLDFEHREISCLSQVPGSAFCGNDLTLVQVPVANLTRTLTITSADQVNRPGHLAVIGHDATGVFEHVALVGVGRTCNGVLSNTTPDLSTIGTCQAGRYALHFHHSLGAGSRVVGASLVGSHLKSKWGLVIHQTSDVRVEGSVCVDFPGSCFVTEDGNEARNVFVGNLAAYVDGDGTYRPGSEGPGMIGANRPGAEGGCFWHRGQINSWIGNQAWDCRYGHVFMNTPIATQYPSKPGGDRDADIGYRPVPIEWRDNAFVGSLTNGIDQWKMRLFPIIRLILAHGVGSQFIVGPQTDQIGVHLIEPHVVNEVGAPSIALDIPRPYVEHLLIERPVLQGSSLGLGSSGGRTYTVIRGGVIQTSTGLDFPPAGLPGLELVVENVEFRAPTAAGAAYINYGSFRPWEPAEAAGSLSGCAHRIINWQGTGKNYCLSGYGTAPGSSPIPPPGPQPPPPSTPVPSPTSPVPTSSTPIPSPTTTSTLPDHGGVRH